METPICDFVSEYLKKDCIRLHMPGHKGDSFFCAEQFDITEIDGADELYNARGIIKQSEENAASLYGSAKTLYSTEGSSLSIRAMLYLVKIYARSKGINPLIAAARNVHSSFIAAASMLDFDVEWLYSETKSPFIVCSISKEHLEISLSKMAEKPVALYITSPDYLGNIADIKGFADVCHKHGVLLIVDNAHGAYLNFLPNPLHPIHLGADMVCDSAHKTLPVLTGGAYLHISKNTPAFFSEHAERAMSLFSSTSPSYIILQSLDYINKYLANRYRKDLLSFIDKLKYLKDSLIAAGYTLCGNEPLKICIATKKYGYLGTELADILKSKNIISEFADPDFLVLMLTPQNPDADLKNLEKALLSIEKRNEISLLPPILTRPKKICSPREAIMSPVYETDIEKSRGMVFASCNIGCPPALPILVCGEQIDDNAIELFKYYNIKKCLTKSV